MFHVCLCYAVLSVPCSLVITCWKRAGPLALLCVVFSCVCVCFFCHFPICFSGPCVVLDCIDSGSLSSSLLSFIFVVQTDTVYQVLAVKQFMEF